MAAIPRTLPAEEKPFFALTDLFEAGQAGYTTYRAPTLLVSPKGTILVSVEARKDGFGDWADVNTVIRRSTDGGKNLSDGR